MVLKGKMVVFVVLNVTCFHGFGWVLMVSIFAVVVSLGKLKCRMLLAAYDIRIGGLVVSLNM